MGTVRSPEARADRAGRPGSEELRPRIAPPSVGEPSGTPAEFRLPPHLAERSAERTLACSLFHLLTVVCIAGLVVTVAFGGVTALWAVGAAVCAVTAAGAATAARMQTREPTVADDEHR